MRVNGQHLLYACLHPVRALRYLRHRDRIPYHDIARFLPKKPVIVEAGAHDGTNTIEMADFWPGATIHAFEPVPFAAAAVSERIRPYGGRVQCHAMGLGPYDGTIDMHVSGDGSSHSCQSSSMLAPAEAHLREFPEIRFGLTRAVPVVKLDSWAELNGIDRIDFIWFDMQGYELQALEGARRLLPMTSAIQLEISNVSLYEGAPLYPEVKARMAAWGFRPAVEAFFRVSGNVRFVRSTA